MIEGQSESDLRTRRGLLGGGLALAAVLTGLAARTAWADDNENDRGEDRHGDGDHRGEGRGGDNGRHGGRDDNEGHNDNDRREDRPAEERDEDEDEDNDDECPRPPRQPGQRPRTFTSDLCRVSEVTADFSAASPGTDPLEDGQVRLRRRNASGTMRLRVILRGAAPNVSYEVFLQPVARGRESLGMVGPTNAQGNLSDLTTGALAGTHRVGQFVLVRRGGAEDGRDEFVTCLGG